MQRFSSRSAYRAALAAFIAAVALAACGGGSGPNLPHTTPPTPTPTATPPPLPSPSAQSNSSSVTPSNTAATTATLPATGGITATVTVPQLTAGSGAVNVTVATGADATMARERAAAARHTLAMAGGPYLMQLDFVPSQTITLAAVPSFSLDITQYVTSAGLTIPQAAALLQNEDVYAGIVDGAGDFNVVGPLTVSATSAALTVSYTGPAVAVTLTANEHYTVGVHLGPITAPTSSPTASPTSTPTSSPTSTPTSSPTSTPTASPTSTPTSSPTATPTATPAQMTVTPTSLNFPGGSGPIYTFDPQDINISGGVAPYSADGYDNTVISVQANSNGYGYSSSFTVTPLQGGATTITIHDSSGQSATVSVGVTSASGVIQ